MNIRLLCIIISLFCGYHIIGMEENVPALPSKLSRGILKGGSLDSTDIKEAKKRLTFSESLPSLVVPADRPRTVTEEIRKDWIEMQKSVTRKKREDLSNEALNDSSENIPEKSSYCSDCINLLDISKELALLAYDVTALACVFVASSVMNDPKEKTE